MKNTYLIWAIVGTVLPVAFFITFFMDHGIGLISFGQGVFANGAAGGFAADLFITSAVFWVFMFTQRSGPNPWPFILANLCIGLSLAFPAYLYVLAKQKDAS